MGFIGSSLCLRGHYWRGYAHKSLKVASMPDDCNGIRLDNPHSWHIKGWRWNGRTEWDKMGGRHWMNGQRVLFIKDKCIWMRCVCFCSLKGLCYITEIKTELWTHCSCDSSCPNAVSVSFFFFYKNRAFWACLKVFVHVYFIFVFSFLKSVNKMNKNVA